MYHHTHVLVGVYGDVIRVKILYNKRDSALIQFKEPQHAQTGTSLPCIKCIHVCACACKCILVFFPVVLSHLECVINRLVLTVHTCTGM